MRRLKLSLCTQCSAFDVSDIARIDLPEGVEVAASPCLGPCETASVLALQTPGHAGYVFAGVTLNDAPDIAATCALILESPDGWIEDARPCGRLRHLLVARMPA